MLKNIYLSAAIIWSCSILFLCLESFSNLPNVEVEYGDKYVHFTFHFLFVILWFLYFNYKNSRNKYRTIILLFSFSLFFGILIEFVQQNFTTARKADIYDVFANTIGAFFALIFILAYDFAFKSNSKLV